MVSVGDADVLAGAEEEAGEVLTSVVLDTGEGNMDGDGEGEGGGGGDGEA